MIIIREKSSQSRQIHSATLRDEIGVPHKIEDFEGVHELNRIGLSHKPEAVL